MTQGVYEDGARTLTRNEERLARQEQAKRDDRRAEAAVARRGRRSI